MSTDGTAGKRIAFIDISSAMQANRAQAIIGLPGVAMVTAVALRQDKLRCPGKPVVIYSQELMAAMNTRNPITFRRARDKAIAAGWLVFIPGTTRSPGQYSAQVAPGYSSETASDYVTHLDTYSDTYLNTYSDTLGNSISTLISNNSQSLSLASPSPALTGAHAVAASTEGGEDLTPPITEEPKEPRSPKAEDVPVPEPLDTPEFRKAVTRWIGIRRKRRWPVDFEYVQEKFEQLVSLGASQATACLEYSNTNRYQGLIMDRFQPKASKAGPGQNYDPNAGKDDPNFGVM